MTPCVDLDPDRLHPAAEARVAAADAVVSFRVGTGFFVSASGDILTNAHVAEAFGPEGLVWMDQGGEVQRRAVVRVRVDPALDLALYRAPAGQPQAFVPLRERPVEVGEVVCMVMNPLARGEQVGVGRVVGPTRRVQGIPSIRYDAPSLWGASGSPVVDAAGELVAVHWGWKDGVDYGIPADVVREWLLGG